MHEANTFITLTYRTDALTYGFVRPTLYPKHLQDFIKRLRAKVRWEEINEGLEPRKIKFFACGEYGEEEKRPHYHACIFGMDFDDKELLPDRSHSGFDQYTSKTLAQLWGHGRVAIGEVNFQTAGYTARYIMDKKTGEQAQYYEQHGLEPEFVRMSRRPGIGASWFETYSNDVFPYDEMVVNGQATRPPRYYSSKFQSQEPVQFSDIKIKRQKQAEKHNANNTPERLNQKHKVKLAQIAHLRRKLI